MLIVVWIYFFRCCRANNQSINHQSVGTRNEEREKHNHFANQPRSNYNCGGNMILSAKLDFTLRFWASASFINWTQTCGRQNCFFFQLFFFSLSVGVFYPFFCKRPCHIGTDSINRSISFFRINFFCCNVENERSHLQSRLGFQSIGLLKYTILSVKIVWI